MRVLVCGSRTFDNLNLVGSVLQGMYVIHEVGFLLTHVDHFTVIAGEAPGADRLARDWAQAGGIHPYNLGEIEAREMCSVYYEGYPADWVKHGRWAGPIRNQQMLEQGRPGYVVAFIDKPLEESRGTFDMVKRAWKAGLPVTIVQHWEGDRANSATQEVQDSQYGQEDAVLSPHRANLLQQGVP